MIKGAAKLSFRIFCLWRVKNEAEKAGSKLIGSAET